MLEAPGVAELARPGQFVALAVGGDDLGRPAAAQLLDPQGQPTGHLRRHRRDRRRRRRRRHRGGSPSCAPTPRSTSSARWGGPSRCPRGRSAASSWAAATAARRCSGWPTCWSSAAAASRPCWAPRRETGSSGWSRRDVVAPTASRSPPTTGRPGSRAGSATCCPRSWPGSTPPWSTRCGPMGMLRSVTELATAHGAVAQVAVEESMACGIGVCMTCVHAGATRDRRAGRGWCAPASRARPSAVTACAGTPSSTGAALVPADAVGAPVALGGGGH